MAAIIELPIPLTFEQWVWLGIGITFARAFGKRLDHDIQNTIWFIDLPGWAQWVLKRLLDFLHHWWMGALLMLYGPGLICYWFGYGLFLDDLPDIPGRIGRYLKVRVK